MIFHLEEMPTSVRLQILSILNKGLRNLIKLMEKSGILSNESAFEHRRSLQSNTMSQLLTANGTKVDINLIRNSLKAYVYLMTFFLAENSKFKESKENQTKYRRRLPPKTGRSTG